MKIHSFALLAFIFLFSPDTCQGNKASRPRRLGTKGNSKGGKKGKKGSCLSDHPNNALAALGNQALTDFWADIMTDSECETEGIGKVYDRYFTYDATVQINNVVFFDGLDAIKGALDTSVSGYCTDGNVLS